MIIGGGTILSNRYGTNIALTIINNFISGAILLSLNCIVDPDVNSMEPFIDNKLPYMYVDNVKEHSDPVTLLRLVIGTMKVIIKHFSSTNSDNFGENLKKYMTEIKNSLRIYDSIKKNHTAMEKGLSEMRKSLHANLERMEMDEKKSREGEDHPTPKQFKANPGNGHSNDSMDFFDFESPENNEASINDGIRASNNLVSTDAGKIPLIQL